MKFQSVSSVESGGSSYQVIVTDKRLVLYARRGMVFKKDDVISESLSDIQGIKYKEEGILNKKGIIEVSGRTKIPLEGKPSEIKALYQNLLPFMK